MDVSGVGESDISLLVPFSWVVTSWSSKNAFTAVWNLKWVLNNWCPKINLAFNKIILPFYYAKCMWLCCSYDYMHFKNNRYWITINTSLIKPFFLIVWIKIFNILYSKSTVSTIYICCIISQIWLSLTIFTTMFHYGLRVPFWNQKPHFQFTWFFLASKINEKFKTPFLSLKNINEIT